MDPRTPHLAREVVLANEMMRRNARYGLISACSAGATAAATILEREPS